MSALHGVKLEWHSVQIRDKKAGQVFDSWWGSNNIVFVVFYAPQSAVVTVWTACDLWSSLCALQGAAVEDGRLKRGDQIIAVNGHCLEGVTHAEAVDILKKTKGTVVLTVLSWDTAQCCADYITMSLQTSSENNVAASYRTASGKSEMADCL